MEGAAQVMGLDMRIELGLWDEVRAQLERGEIDAITGMVYSPQREQRVDFSIPHSVIYHAVFVREGSSIEELADLEDKEVIVQESDIMHDFIKGVGYPVAIVTVDSPTEALRLLSSGLHDAALIAEFQGLYLAKQFELTNLTTTGASFSPHEYCFAVQEGDAALLGALNEGLRILKATGRYKEIYDKWFGIYERSYPATLLIRYAYKYLLWTLLPLLLLFGILIGRSWSLRRQVNQRTRELQHELAERRQVEDKLRASEKKYREVVESANSIILRLDCEGRVLFFNKFAQEFFGYAEDEILGRSVVGTIVPETESSGRDLQAVIKDLAKHPESYRTHENENMRKNGERVWVLWANQPILDQKGQLTEVLCIGNDITATRRAEEERKRLVRAVEEAVEAIVITDMKGRIQYVNPAFETITGYPRGEALDKTPRMLDEGGHEEGIYRNIEQVVSNGEVWSGHVIAKKKSGRSIEGEVTISPVRNTFGQISNYVAVARDVTGEMRLERQLRQAQKLEGIGTLAGGIAHDFNNILAVILGNAELAQMDLTENNRYHQYLEEIREAGLRGKNLVEQILTFSRQVETRRSPVEVAPIVLEGLRFLRSTIPTTITIEERIDRQAGPVLADPAQIHQLIVNLCTNAYQAMQEMGGTLTVSLSRVHLDAETASRSADLHEGEYLKLVVSDTGEGMDRGTLERIFEPFFTTKDKARGTGLGLATVHGIVMHLGGAIFVDSEPHKGSTFTVFLPRHEKDITAAPPHEAKGQAGRGEHILLVDDQPPVLQVVRHMIEKLGYSVTGFSSSMAALDAFIEAPDRYDLVIADQTMPEFTGTELAQKMLGIRPDLPIILTTGYSELITEEQARAIGIQAYFMKPYTQSDIAGAIRSLLDSKAQVAVDPDPKGQETT